MGRPRVVPFSSCCVVTDHPRRGELWWCELPDIGSRPVVVLSRDVAIPRLGRAVIAPCTTTVRGLPSPASTRSRASAPSISTRWRACPSASSSAGSVVWATNACAPSAMRSRSPSTVTETPGGDGAVGDASRRGGSDDELRQKARKGGLGRLSRLPCWRCADPGGGGAHACVAGGTGRYRGGESRRSPSGQQMARWQLRPAAGTHAPGAERHAGAVVS